MNKSNNYLIFLVLTISIQAIAKQGIIKSPSFEDLYKINSSKLKSALDSSPEIEEAFYTYTTEDDTFYKDINGYLRNYPEEYDWDSVNPNESAVIVKNLDKLFELASTDIPDSILLHRGFSLGWRNNKEFSIGEEYYDKGYVSTSMSYRIAHHFSIGIHENTARAEDKKALISLYRSKNKVRGLFIKKNGEKEVLLKHNQRFRVMKKSKKLNYDAYLVQICKIDFCENDILNKDIIKKWEDSKIED